MRQAARATRLALGLALGTALLVAAAEPPPSPAPSPSPRPFAERVAGLRGVENVARVAPGLYRGAAPSREGLDALVATLGVRTVVNLRHYHGSREERWCKERGLAYFGLRVESSDAPTDEQVRDFLRLATDPGRRPLYFHCWRGSDRTGSLCAAYRMAVEGWPLAAAEAEMQEFGFFDGWRDLLGFVRGFPARQEALWPTKP